MDPENSLFVHWNNCPMLAPFSQYLREVGVLKFSGISPHSLDMHYNEGIELNYVVKGTYKWVVGGKHYQLYPGEAFITCPWEYHGSPEKILDRGILSWMILKPATFSQDGRLCLGHWSRIKAETQMEIGRLLAGNTNPVIPKGSNLIELFRKLHREISNQDIGYEEKIHLLLDSLVIRLARILKTRESCKERDDDFVAHLTRILKEDFNRKIKVADLAYAFGMSATSFNNKVKTLTGYSPADYLIELKLDAAKELLIADRQNITGIAAECGFYSSQHFATLFSKRVGKTPSQFRKNAREK